MLKTHRGGTFALFPLIHRPPIVTPYRFFRQVEYVLSLADVAVIESSVLHFVAETTLGSRPLLNYSRRPPHTHTHTHSTAGCWSYCSGEWWSARYGRSDQPYRTQSGRADGSCDCPRHRSGMVSKAAVQREQRGEKSIRPLRSNRA